MTHHMEVISVSPYEWPFQYSPDGKPLHVADLSDKIWCTYKQAVEDGHRIDSAPLEVFDRLAGRWVAYGPKLPDEGFHWGTTEYRLGAGSPAALTRGTRFAQRQPDGSVRYIQQPTNSVL